MKTILEVMLEKQCSPDSTEFRYGSAKPRNNNDYIYMIISKVDNTFITLGELTDDEYLSMLDHSEIIKVLTIEGEE